MHFTKQEFLTRASNFTVSELETPLKVERSRKSRRRKTSKEKERTKAGGDTIGLQSRRSSLREAMRRRAGGRRANRLADRSSRHSRSTHSSWGTSTSRLRRTRRDRRLCSSPTPGGRRHSSLQLTSCSWEMARGESGVSVPCLFTCLLLTSDQPRVMPV